MVPDPLIPARDRSILTMQRYSKSQVKRAGDVIKASNSYPYTDDVLEAFGLAHRWRQAHYLPMHGGRADLKRIARQAGIGGKTSGRLKRFQSIRRKLRRLPYTLYQMQDLAGARIIVDNISEVERLSAAYRSGESKHEFLGEDDHVAKPKDGGYRSVHFMMRYAGDEDKTAGNRLTFEVQVRTRLQHAWATAVEAVGAVRGEELKSGFGDADWLRFFTLMSAEFATEERRPLGRDVPQTGVQRYQELIALERKLDAVVTLESYRRVIQGIGDFKRLPGSSFLIEFDARTNAVHVRTNSNLPRLAELLDVELNPAINAVVVEVDRVDDLLSAYPNYFLDVEMFTQRLRSILGRGRAVQAPSQDASPVKQADEWLAQWVMGSRRNGTRFKV